jgi:MOSC domain-containing protein YiiM
MQSIAEVRAIPGRGLEGDRYHREAGTFSRKGEPAQEVTLVELEAVVAAARDRGFEIEPGALRRNLVTEGVPLNHLVGREFRVGDVVLRGLRLCEPCTHLQRLTRDGVVAAYVHRGGLRAQIVTGGLVRVGAPVVWT